MKWLAFFLILISIGGSFCDDVKNCVRREDDKCGERLQPPTEFPQTAEDLLAACGIVISFGNCMVEARESCNDDSETDVHQSNRIQPILDYVKSTCQEDNPTFKVISSNLPCVERVAKSRGSSCRARFSEKNLEVLDTQLELLIGEDYGTELASCLFNLIDVACEAVTFGYHCGEEVKEAVEEIEAHFNSPRSLECSPEHLEELSSYMTMFEGLLVEDLALKNALERKRK